MKLTNPREVAAFFLARVIVLAVYFVIAPMLLTPLFMQLFQAGGAIMMTFATLSVGFLTWLVTLVLFLALRGGFGGVPPRVAGQGRRDALTSSAGEIAAFLIAVLIVMVVVSAFNALVLPGIYALARQSGGTMWVMPISLGISLVSAVAFFLIFVAMRGAMPAAAGADGPPDLYDDGAASMGFGRAVATCFRKYAVFSGRASRSEYWFWALFHLLLIVALIFVDALVFRGTVFPLTTLAWLIMILPGFAVTVRRLHDIDMSGWFMLVSFVPLIGQLVLLVWTCTRGTEGPNRFGMGPSHAAIPEVFA